MPLAAVRPAMAFAAGLSFAPITAAAQCTITTMPINFGTYLPFSSTPMASTGTVTVGCRLYGPYAISLSAGAHSGGTFSDRRMRHATSYMSYQLYTNASHTTVWGDGSGGTTFVTGFCSGVCSNPYTVYAQVAARQLVRPGNYADTITVMVNF